MTELTTYTEQTPLTAQMDYARAVSSASMLPDNYRGKPADILLAVGLGQSMGLSPAESLYRISVIKGKPTASAELVAANVRKAGHRLRVQIDPGRAVCSIWRSDDPEFEFTVVRDAAWAQQMGLAQNDNYRKQGDTMLSWRAITACARLACPEALYGVAYTSDEMFDMDKRQPQWSAEQTSDPDPGTGQPVESIPPPSPEVVDEPSGSEPLLLNTSSKLAKAMYASINDAGITDAERIPWISSVIGRDIESSKEMTEDEARLVLKHLDDATAVAAEVVE